MSTWRLDLTGPSGRRAFALQLETPVWIGSSADADLRLDGIEPVAAMFCVESDGPVVRAAGAARLRVNGVETDRAPLSAADLIVLGPYRLALRRLSTRGQGAPSAPEGGFAGPAAPLMSEVSGPPAVPSRALPAMPATEPRVEPSVVPPVPTPVMPSAAQPVMASAGPSAPPAPASAGSAEDLRSATPSESPANLPGALPIALPVTPALRPKPPIDVAAMAGVAGTGAGLTGPDDLARVTPAAVRERIREMLLASAIIHAVVALWATLAPPPPKLELARALELQSRFVALLVQPPTKPEVPPPTEADKASQKSDERRKPSQRDISRPPPAPADEGPSAGPEAPTSPPVALPGETDRGKDLLADLPGAAPSGVGAGATPRIGALEGMGDVNLPGADSASPGLGGLGIGRNPAGAISGGRAVGGGGAQGASGVAQPDGKEREAIRATFAEHRAQIQYCYETHGPRTRRDLRVEVRLTLVQRRMASRPKPRFKANTRLDPAFTTCLRTAIGQWSFKGVRPIPIGIKYPIVFRSNAE